MSQPITTTEIVRVPMGMRDTRDDVREYAKLEARRNALDRTGVYVSGETITQMRSVEDNRELKQTDSRESRVQAITLGTAQIEIVTEKWEMEQDQLVFYLTCNVTVNPEEVKSKLGELKIENSQRDMSNSASPSANWNYNKQRSDNSGAEQRSAPEIPPDLYEKSASGWLDEANRSNNQDQKIRSASNALLLNPMLESAYLIRGEAFFNRSQFEEALKDFSSVIKQNGRSLEALIFHGRTCMAIGLKDQALSDFNSAIEINPQSEVAFIYRGRFWLETDEAQKALTDFNSAIGLYSNGTEGYFYRALAYNDLALYEESIVDLRKVERVFPNYPELHIKLSEAYKNIGAFERSRQHEEAAQRLLSK
jgi:tetratricopeptide (TPR) repeat protein